MNCRQHKGRQEFRLCPWNSDRFTLGADATFTAADDTHTEPTVLLQTTGGSGSTELRALTGRFAAPNIMPQKTPRHKLCYPSTVTARFWDGQIPMHVEQSSLGRYPAPPGPCGKRVRPARLLQVPGSCIRRLLAATGLLHGTGSRNPVAWRLSQYDNSAGRWHLPKLLYWLSFSLESMARADLIDNTWAELGS